MTRDTNHKNFSVSIIFAVLLWMAVLQVTAWGSEVPGGGKAVDGTIHNVAVSDISKGSDIVNAPSISDPSDAFVSHAPGSNAASVSASGVPSSGDSPVIVCGAGKAAAVQNRPALERVTGKGVSLGMFTTTGYCLCEVCSGGFDLTYSGTVPQARHTISADISLFPIGTRLMIGDTIYIVEDIGSNVKGNHIDIYYENHEEAMAHGMKTEEVFSVN